MGFIFFRNYKRNMTQIKNCTQLSIVCWRMRWKRKQQEPRILHQSPCSGSEGMIYLCVGCLFVCASHLLNPIHASYQPKRPAFLEGVHTVNIIRYGMVPVFFIRFRYANGIDTGYFLYFVDVFEILSRALVLGKVWWGWTSTM